MSPSQPTYIYWPPDDQDNCASWASTAPVQRFLGRYPEEEASFDMFTFPSEALLSAIFHKACQQLGQVGSHNSNFIDIDPGIHLNWLHDDTWKESVPYDMYHQCLIKAASLSPDLSKTGPGSSSAVNEDTISVASVTASTSSGPGPRRPLSAAPSRSSAAHPPGSSASTRPSSASGGAYKPDMTTYWTTGRAHATLVMEIKALNRKDASNSKKWDERHYTGLCQAVWYLYGAYCICGTRMGLFLCNNRYQRIIINQDGRFLIEVKDGSTSLDLVDPNFRDCPFGEEEIPNRLPHRTNLSPEDTQPGGSVFRLWSFVRFSLKIAEHCILNNRCPPSPQFVGNLRFSPNVPHIKVTINDAESLGPVLNGVNTFNDAKNVLRYKLRKAAVQAKPAAKQQAGGKDDAGGGQGEGGQDGGEAKGKSRRRDDDGDDRHGGNTKGRKKERTNAGQSSAKGKERERQDAASTEEPQRIVTWLRETRLSCRHQQDPTDNDIQVSAVLDPSDHDDDDGSSSDVDSSDAFPFHPELLIEAMQEAGVRFGFRDRHSMDSELDQIFSLLVPTRTQPSMAT